MARRRMIDPSYWDNSKRIGLSPRQELLYLWAISNANDYGKIQAHPAVLASKVFPLKRFKLESIRKDLEVLQKHRMLCLYAVNGKEYAHLPSWDEWQTIRTKFTDHLPDCPKETHYDAHIPHIDGTPDAHRRSVIEGNRIEEKRKELNKGEKKGKGEEKGKKPIFSKSSSKKKKPGETQFYKDGTKIEALTKNYFGIRREQVGRVSGTTVHFPTGRVHQEQIRENPYDWKVLQFQ